jgi:ABC-type multidrug transport system fused ATPase/permease subunit
MLILLSRMHASNNYVQIRDSAFTSLIRQEVSYFDLRAAGTITSQLADDAAMLHAFVGEPIRTLTVSVSSVVVGLVVSFIFMWPFALLTLGIVPFLVRFLSICATSCVFLSLLLTVIVLNCS